ncbi:MAG: LamG domain-containing protein, partial [Akkermansiaceae bacterium]|nr:LamG domain-containing protein [Akkermansiaceae bacterium]
VRIHEPGDALPITQYPAYTISMWVKVAGTGQNDMRFFSEASTNTNDPLLNLGTRNNGSDDSVDVYLRDAGSPNHQFSNGLPLDGTWRHILYTHSDADQKIQLFIDGELDKDDWIFKDIIRPLNTTTVGGIRRANPSHWINGKVDEVSLWKSVLPEDIITKLASGITVADLLNPGRLHFDITQTDGELVLEWASQAGKLYNLRSETDLSNGDPEDWPIYGGNMEMAATPDFNTLTIPLPDEPGRFFVIEEFPAPPVTVFSDDFESGQGDWTLGTDGADGTAWEIGS